jgi:uncharacterized protein
MAPEFEWDPRKAAANSRKHRIAFAEAVTAFADPLSVTIPDPAVVQFESGLGDARESP